MRRFGFFERQNGGIDRRTLKDLDSVKIYVLQYPSMFQDKFPKGLPVFCTGVFVGGNETQCALLFEKSATLFKKIDINIRRAVKTLVFLELLHDGVVKLFTLKPWLELFDLLLSDVGRVTNDDIEAPAVQDFGKVYFVEK